MSDYDDFDLVSNTPDWSEVLREKMIAFLSAKYNLNPEDVSAIMRISADWAYDNESAKT